MNEYVCIQPVKKGLDKSKKIYQNSHGTLNEKFILQKNKKI